MIYLTTGANGAGKTLNTLKLVREKQVKEGRSVYYNGFDMSPEKAAEFGWLTFDPRDWQALPDGAILLCDECQKQFPVRAPSAAVPPYVAAMAEHRKRGFDFFLITQHPNLIDSFIRRLIGSPGWHRHIKRAFGADMVSVLEWSAVCTTCEKTGAGSDAKVTMVPYPKEVYGWYSSAVLHTGKKSIPFQVYVLALALVLIPVAGYYGWSAVTRVGDKPAKAAPASKVPVSAPPRSAGGPEPVHTEGDYFASYVPRLPGFPHTAPRFDDVVKPVSAPYPAACVRMGSRCDCYTQQATKLQTPPDICDQIVKGGFFVEWQDNRAVALPPGVGLGRPLEGGEVRSDPVFEPPGAAAARSGGWQASDADIRAHLQRTRAFVSDRQ